MRAGEFLKDNYWIIFILALSLLLRICYSSYNLIWWDSAVYIGMAKYIFSLGNSGFWEISRPLVLPLILGFFWKLGANPYVAGRILDVCFSLGCVFLTYLIGKEVFSKRIGLFAAFILSFTPTFFNNGSYLLTEICSTFFLLLGVFLFIKKRYFLAGIFCGISFMTRFLQLFGFFALVLFSFFITKKYFLKRNLLLFTGFLVPIIPYLALNYVMHKDILLPFFHQIYMTANTGFVWHEKLSFYFANMIKESMPAIFVIFFPFYYIKSKNANKHIILLTLLAFAVFYLSVAHKEMRFLITLMPYLFILVGLGFFYITDKLSRISRTAVIILVLSFFLLISIQKYDAGKQDERYEPFWSYLERSDVNGKIWTTNPIFMLKSDKKADLIYYDVFGSRKIIELEQRIKKPDSVLIDSCYDMTCYTDDNACPEMKEEFIKQLKTQFRVIFYENDNGCERMILSSVQ